MEATLEAHPDVYEAAVIGVASELSDEEVKAFVLAGPYRPSSEDLWSWCEGRLARFKVPRYIEFVDDFPRTPTQRIAKHELPATVTGREADRESGA